MFDPTRAIAGQQVERLPAHPQGTFYPRIWAPDSDRVAGTIGNAIVIYDVATAAVPVRARHVKSPGRPGHGVAARRPAAPGDAGRPDGRPGRHRRRATCGSPTRRPPTSCAASACREPAASSTSAAAPRRPTSGSPRFSRSRMLGTMPTSTALPRLLSLAALAVAAFGVTACQPAAPADSGHHRPRPLRRPRQPLRKRPWSRAASAPSPTAPPSISTR